MTDVQAAPSTMSDSEKRALRDAFGCFATGVTVVTTRQADGTPRGFTANSFTSVSLDPPMLLVCIAKTAHSCPIFSEAEHFAVNILSQDQKALSGVFASRAEDKFEQVEWRSSLAEMPVFDGTLAQLVCAKDRVVDAGDHVILLGEVIGHSTAPGQPLGYFRGSYFSTAAEHDLVEAALQGRNVQIGALISDGAGVLLAETAKGALEVPKAPDQNPDTETLCSQFQEAGLRLDLDFLYAVYRDTATARHSIFYHGSATGKPPTGHMFFPIEDLPLDRIDDAAERKMLARFAAEYAQGTFGVYHGDETRGTVQPVTALPSSNA